MTFSRRSDLPSTLPSSDSAPVRFDLGATDTTAWPGNLEQELEVLRLLVRPEAIRYHPDSAGLRSAREALARFQAPADPDRWILTASSSEAYGLLFQLLCDPGSRVGTPQPGYPLVDELGRFHDVGVAPIPLRWASDRWSLDLGWVERRLREGIRALVLIQPANPTGWILSPEERTAVLDLCDRYRVPLVSDEVFEAWAPPGFRTLADQNQTLCFTLGGLSKLVGLPHLKLGWIRVSGPAEEVREAVRRLEQLNDALLSASTPIQAALPDLLERRVALQDRISRRLQGNRSTWARFAADLPEGVEATGGDSGWFGMVRWNGPWAEDAVCSNALAEGVRILPGYLFDLSEAGFVVSLLSAPEDLLHGLGVLKRILLSLDP